MKPGVERSGAPGIESHNNLQPASAGETIMHRP